MPRTLTPTTLFILTALCNGIALNAKAENFARGSDLYAQHCQSCHSESLHRDNPKVKNLKELKARVNAWAAHTGNSWKSQEIDDVVYFLNKSFYRF